MKKRFSPMGEKGIIVRFDEVMHQLMRAFHASGTSCLCGLDLTIQQFAVLNIVHHQTCPKMTDLAAELNVTMGNVTALVDRLIKLKYIKRQADESDRRIVRVGLTAQGKELMKKAEEKKGKAMELMLSKIPQADKRQLLRIMGNLVSSINKEGEIKQ
jgi:MarR family transcriptional regulator, organic hydroperoxide resistance regulator